MARSPAEDLVRDYLSRLTAATRGELDAADRRALVDRTREFIEHQTSLSGRPDPMDVARLLARLGDPAGLVRLERQRLAELRGVDLEAPRQHRGRVGRAVRRDTKALGATWRWPAQEGQAQLQHSLLEEGRPEEQPASGATAGGATAGGATAGGATAGGTAAGGTAAGGASGAEPAPPSPGPARPRPAPWPQRPSLVPAQPDGHDDRGVRRHRPGSSDADTVLTGTVLNGRVLPGRQASGPAADDSPDAVRSGYGGSGLDDAGFDPAGFDRAGFDDTGSDSAGFDSAGFDSAGFDGAGFDPAGSDGAEYEIPADDGPDGDSPPSAEWDKPEGGGWLLNEIAGPVDLIEPAESARQPVIGELAERLGRSTVEFARSLPHRWRHHPIEMTALLLLGPGGLIFPPVWVLGALVALASKLWHPLDKWAALATPVLVTIIAAVLGVICGGSVHFGHDVHDGWVSAVAASRVCAVLSACYLAWRARLGRRPTPVPPWKRTPGAS